MRTLSPSSRLPVARHALAAAVFLVMTTPPAGAQSFVNWETPQVHPIALTPSGATLLAVNTADNRLEVFDVSNPGGVPQHVRSIAVGLDPVSVRARNETEAWVVNHISDSISVIDLPSGRVRATIATGDEPCDVVFAGVRGGQRAFVSVSQLNQVRVFDASTLAPIGQPINIEGEDPRALAVSADGSKVFAAIFESGNRSTIIARQQVSAPNGPYGGLNPPPNDGNTFNPPITPGLPPAPPIAQIVKANGLGQWTDGNNRNWTQFVTWNLHDHDVAIIDTSSLGVTYATGMMNMAAGIDVSAAGNVAVVGTDAINERRFESNINSIFVRCKVGSFTSGAPAATSVNDINPHLTYATTSIAQSQREQSIGDPRAVLWHPDGTRMLVAGMGSNNVIVTNTSGARLGVVNVGQGPTGLAINPAGTRLFVLNKFDGSVSSVDLASLTENARINFFDPTPGQIRDGRRFLYDTHLGSGLGQASCASCHIDGRTDHLAWDMGNPAGQVILFNQLCQAPGGGCVNWHPMKGPMITQTLQGIIGNEPFHWRGEKPDLPSFNVAFTNVQGRANQITPAEMAQMVNFVASIAYPPNPNRNLDNTLRTALNVPGGVGNAANGRNLFQTLPSFGAPPGITCTACHALPDGTNNRVDIPGVDPQGRKNAQLRNMHEKTGFSRASQNNNRGFGFNHDGTADGLFQLMSGPGFNFQQNATGDQQKRDIEAFMLSLSVDTFAGVGAQTTVIDGSNVPPNQLALINQFITLASANPPAVGLVVKGKRGSIERGYVLVAGQFQSDKTNENYAPAALLALAAPGSELTYTLVPNGSQQRIGFDRDGDGFRDGDERLLCSSAADAASTPVNACAADIAVPHDDMVNTDDLLVVITMWGAGGGSSRADIAPTCEGNGVVDTDDLIRVIAAWGPCP